MWDEDGDKVFGTFVRFDSGPTREYGPKPIAVLLVNGEERSIWLLETALFGRVRDELNSRPNKNLTPGERIGISRQEKTKTQDGSRSYRPSNVAAPAAPQRRSSTGWRARRAAASSGRSRACAGRAMRRVSRVGRDDEH